ncbi:putative bifunctional diguanylate cyclase/phosphodiesterase [Planococcus lenghuensis]|uniref:GGDEF-domain containing protein n=1 Tax=Planococcus lenghuensis TaxID=2213202 RepID=A0A1Q2L146_9BACL|nr:EAL domain-containing protein [Planococcus lenghuensis]AQQ54159.1 GGDEF-domain containing protein [Planococcus lenghuensis]
MLKLGRLRLVILLGVIVSYCSWMVIFQDDEWIRSLGVNLFQIGAVLITLYWLVGAFRYTDPPKRNFWLLLGIGATLSFSSNLTWLYQQVIHSAVDYQSASYVIWLLSYLCYLAALIYKVRELSTSASKNPYLFNIIVYMIAATSFSLHYLVNPTVISQNSFVVNLSTLLYSVVDLSILFVITLLFYLNQQRKEKRVGIYIVIAFSFQVTADSLYAYFTVHQVLESGTVVDLLWVIAMLFIGFAGYQAKWDREEPSLQARPVIDRLEFLFPYIGILVLIIAVMASYRWDLNALSLGLLIIFMMVMGRQLLVINRNKKLADEYKHLAYHDQLTGLNNRIGFIEDIKAVIDDTQNARRALLLIDLDRFKVINDSLGHFVGDKVLVQTATRLNEVLGTEGAAYRLGGDEFIVMLPDMPDAEYAAVAEAILETFSKPFLVDDYEVNVTPSVGISLFPENGRDSEELLKNADAAMYLAKANGKNGFRFYSSDLNATLERKMTIENELKKAIEKEELFLVYQPKVDLQSREVIGAEALLRWRHPKLGFVSPGEFIPVAEETGQIIRIGEWVMREASRQNKAWQEKGFAPMCISINVSVLQFQREDFLETVDRALTDAKLDPGSLELEITESVMQNVWESTQILKRIRKMGVRVSLDDFGTGYSSLHVLQNLPIDTLKIDKSFIDALTDINQHAMVKTIVELGLNLNLDIVAEGIEEEYQVQVLTSHKCRIGQGYLFSRPVAPEEFEQLLVPVQETVQVT